MNDSLRSNVHVGTRCHLTVLRYAHRVHAFPVVRLGIIWNDHAVGDDNPRRVFVRREQPHGMAAVHGQRLVLGHLTEVVHG